ncbi:MAG: hypothetical protein RLZ35_321, partial [Pseudomonadota bacterium]
MNAVLAPFLKPLNQYLEDPNLEELSIFKPKEVWLKAAGQDYARHRAEPLDYAYLSILCQVLANIQDVAFSPKTQSRLATILPQGHRFEAMFGENINHGLSISIRLFRESYASLKSFGLNIDDQNKILEQVHKKGNIVISGGTSSGKTTLLNLLIKEIPLSKRILTVEDTYEMRIPHIHHVGYRTEINHPKQKERYGELIDHLMRSSGDILLVGEISVTNSVPYIRLLNTGHSGVMCTVHANTPEDCLKDAIPRNVRLAGQDDKGVEALLYKNIDLVIQVNRDDRHQRRVTELFFPKLNERMQD